MPTITVESCHRKRGDYGLDRGRRPFPYSKDGIDFPKSGRSPAQEAQGYYQEYTVITPGESDRGARRIIGGRQGELYYTADHYATFYRIVEP